MRERILGVRNVVLALRERVRALCSGVRALVNRVRAVLRAVPEPLSANRLVLDVDRADFGRCRGVRAVILASDAVISAHKRVPTCRS